jgi:hypothetical protein
MSDNQLRERALQLFRPLVERQVPAARVEEAVDAFRTLLETKKATQLLDMPIPGPDGEEIIKRYQ